MRITNVRRGRIIRIGGLCIILLLLIYALHSYSSDSSLNVDIISNDILADPQKSYYKFHRDVYPVLKTGSEINNYRTKESTSRLTSTRTLAKNSPSKPELSKYKEVSTPSSDSVYIVKGTSVLLLQKLGNFEPTVIKVGKGPGEEGKAYHMAADRVNDIADSESEYGMNIAASDDIAMNRSVLDTRSEECKYWHYPTDLPSTSVIIVFHNEGFSVLMRTVHSVIDRSPPNILHEVVLVDDFSDKENLKQNLDIYIRRWNGKVRLIRNSQREGLIRTRSRGAQEATGDVIVFLDAHCEVNTNWLPPLLAPIYRDYRIMTVPVIDGIDHKTFEYRPVYQHDTNYRGIFEWGMLYKENEVPDREASLHKHPSEPYKSPTHAGGLFAINRRYFLEIGAYDPGLLVWGGENFELSFKIWQCGGSIEWVPCSRVGHVYRAFMPYSFGTLAKNRKGSLITINYKRVIETWFDEEHKEYFYTREPMARFLDMGDISEQIALKEKLKCKSFSWFMENVAYDVYDKFPKLPKNVHWGMVKNKATGLCLDTMGKPAPAYIGTSGCHGAGNNQLFRLNEAGQLGVGERCVEGDTDSIKQAICRLGTVDGPWRYDEQQKQLVHRLHGHCLTLQPPARTLGLAPCDPRNTYQQWTITHRKPNW